MLQDNEHLPPATLMVWQKVLMLMDMRSIVAVSSSPNRSISRYQVTLSTMGSCVVKTNGSNKEVSSPSDSLSSLVTPTSSNSPIISHEIVASPTSASASPLPKEVVSRANVSIIGFSTDDYFLNTVGMKLLLTCGDVETNPGPGRSVS